MLRDSIKDEFSLHNAKITPTQQGFSQSTYYIDQDGVLSFLKTYPSHFDMRAALNAHLLLKSHSLPFPQVLQSTSQDSKVNAILYEEVHGRQIRNSDPHPQELSIFEQAGALLKKMHQIPLEGYGNIMAAGDTVRGEYDTHEEYVAGSKQKFEERVIPILDTECTSQEKTCLLKAVELNKQYRPSNVRFLFNDLHANHIFVDEDANISGLIDIDNAMAGDPLYDVANAQHFQTDKQTEAFMVGYGPLTKEQERQVTLFQAEISAFKLGWCIAHQRPEERILHSRNKLKESLVTIERDHLLS